MTQRPTQPLHASLPARTSSGPRRRRGLALLGLLCALALPVAARAGTFVAFGPESFERSAGEPDSFERSFSVLSTATSYTLQIWNGGMDGALPHISSATVELNGSVVVERQDWNQNVSVIERAVSLELLNTLVVRLSSEPGGTLLFQVVGVDDEPPQISASVSPEPNAAGWNNTDVAVSFTCSDGISGIASCPEPLSVSAEAAGQVVTGTAVDHAGNEASVSVTVNLDRTAPSLQALANPPANAAGWHNTDVLVSFEASDSLSGVVEVSAPVAVSSEGKAQSLSGTATDAAGNTASAELLVSLDKTPPVLASAAEPPANAAGWNNTPVTVSFEAADSLSGVESVSAPVVLDAEGGSQSVTGTARDLAGNEASAASLAVSIDRTAPAVVAMVEPQPNAAGWNNTAVTVRFEASDALSGVASLSEPVVLAGDGAGQSTTGTATDTAGNSASAAALVDIDRAPPELSLSTPADGAVLGASPAELSGTAGDGLSGLSSVTCNGAPATVLDGSFSCQVPLEPGVNTLMVLALDEAGNERSASRSVSFPAGAPEPEPSPLDPGVPTSFVEATAFLYSGPDAVQTGLEPGVLEPRRAAVLRGRVLERSGEPLGGVEVSVAGHPELGSSQSRADGLFDLAVNGGGPVLLSYRKAGHAPAQRRVEAPWQDYAWLEDVVLVPYDSAVTAIDVLAPFDYQVARGSVVSDSDGQRQATLVFPPGIEAAIHLPGGGTEPLDVLHIRATEYTSGERGPAAMPAPLPAQSAYTYAVELSADEAVSSGVKRAGKDVLFNMPVSLYVENFLGFPVGSAVPVGYYDNERAAWVPHPNGRVVELLGDLDSDGVPELDLNGDGQPDSAAALLALGISAGEREQLSTLYAPGQSLWRVSMDHLSTWDCNWGWGCITNLSACIAPVLEAVDFSAPVCDSCKLSGSVLDVQNQTLGEALGVAGSPLALHYQSERVRGYAAARTLRAALSGPQLPAGVIALAVEVSVAGQRVEERFAPLPNQTYSFTWDGKDAYGRLVQGSVPVRVRRGYVYRGAYETPAALAASFGYNGSGLLMETNRMRGEITFWQEDEGRLGTWDATQSGLGGWSLSEHHTYEPLSKRLYRGDGSLEIAQARGGFAMRTVAGNGSCYGPTGNGGPGTAATLCDPKSVAAAADGSLYIIEAWDHAQRVRRLSADGILTHFASVPGPMGSDVGPDGTLYVASRWQRVWRIDAQGAVTAVAGSGAYGYSGDGGPALQASFRSPSDVAVAADGTLYISDTLNQVIRRVGPDGLIRTVAGQHHVYGYGGYAGDGGPATAARLDFPRELAVGPDGSLYIADSRNHCIRRVGPDGIITTVAGTGVAGYSGDGGPARAARLNQPWGVALAPDGSVYISDSLNFRVRRVAADGIITTVAGTGLSGYSGDGGPPLLARLLSPDGVEVGPDGTLYIADGAGSDRPGSRIRQVGFGALELHSAAERIVVSRDGAELYVFDASGRHARTHEALGGATLWSFFYDEAGRLAAVQDRAGERTSVERDEAGRPLGLVGPYGQRTELLLDADGLLARVTRPDAQSLEMLYHDADGLLRTLRDARGTAKHYEYDELGRLSRDADALGGFVALERVHDSAERRTVEVSSALGRTSTYDVQLLSTGAELRTNTFASGQQSVLLLGADQSRTLLRPDGTTSVLQLGPDPRFGMQAPLPRLSTVTTPAGLSSTQSMSRSVVLGEALDPLSLLSQTDTLSVNGRSFVSVYDAASRTLSGRSPLGRSMSSTLDELGRPLSSAVPGLVGVELYYDAHGRLGRLEQGSRAVQYSYDELGRVQSVTDPLLRTTHFERDVLGRVLAQTLADGREVRFLYDENGNVTSLTPPGRPMHVFGYNVLDLLEDYVAPDVLGLVAPTNRYSFNLDRQVTQISRPDGQTIDFGYDPAGRLSTLTFDRGQLTYSYSPTTGKLVGVTAPGGESLSYTHDGPLPLSTSWSGTVAGSIERVYDNNFRVTSQTVNGAHAVALGYDLDGLLVSAGSLTLARDPQNGLVTGSAMGAVTDSLGYNGHGEVTSYVASFSGSPLYSVSYTRDLLGRITEKTEVLSGETHTESYTYDLAGRLTDVLEDGVQVAHYAWDDNGNRLGLTDGTGTTSGTYDAQDRLLTYGTLTFTYNPNGELETKTDTATGEVTEYFYDTLGNLVAVDLPDGTAIRYIIDPANRRVGKRVNGILEQTWLYEGITPVAELDGAGNVVARFVPGGMVKGGVLYRMITDHLGSPRLVVNASTGEVAQRMEFDEFGNVLLDTNPGFQPFGFAGGLWDADTGLVRFGARDYDPVVGRWTARDPILFAGGDTNLYGYVLNDPINATDPLGLQGNGAPPGLQGSGGPVTEAPPKLKPPPLTKPAPTSPGLLCRLGSTLARLGLIWVTSYEVCREVGFCGDPAPTQSVPNSCREASSWCIECCNDSFPDQFDLRRTQCIGKCGECTDLCYGGGGCIHVPCWSQPRWIWDMLSQ